MVGKVIDVMTKSTTGYSIRKVDKSMLEHEFDKMDDAFPQGMYTLPSEPNRPRIKIRALHEYCEKYGVEPKDLSEEEVDQFIQR